MSKMTEVRSVMKKSDDAEFLRWATSLAAKGLVDEWLTVMAPVIIGTRRIAKAIRGNAISGCQFSDSGDSFYVASFSEFAAWPNA